MGGLVGMEAPHISLAAESLFYLGPLAVTNSLVMMFITMAVVFWFLSRTAGRATMMPGGRLQALGEWLVEALLGLVEGVAGRQVGRQIFPLIGTLFTFILLANWLALFPGVGSIGVCAVHNGHEITYVARDECVRHEEAPPAETPAPVEEEAAGPIFTPLFRPANADLNMTVAMAIVAVVTVQAMGIKYHNVGGYLKELATPWFLFPVHVISELSRILSLSARLFGNIFGGEVFLFVIFFLFPLFIPLIPMGLELFFGLIQAVLFSVLTLVYCSMAAAGHGGGHHEGETYGHAGHPEAGPTAPAH